ncbi:hypothetical protein [Streptomyces sp. NPDC051657]|uniref:hypothetical protein n=1 Tax=unclassified Streptomyces TaxID=2593676 RepID=UPI0034133DB2
MEKKDSNIKKIRNLFGEVDRTHRQRPAQDLLRLIEEIGTCRDQLTRPLPATEAKLVERWRRRLEEQRHGTDPHAIGRPCDGCGTCLLGVRRLSRVKPATPSPERRRENVLTPAASVGAHIIGWADDWEVSGAPIP